MKISKLIQNIANVRLINFIDLQISNLSHNSKEKNENGIFFCIKGDNFDGSKFVKESINNGTICIVSEEVIKGINIPQIIVMDTRIAISIIAKEFYENCCDKLKIIGVVGTNGKTTTVSLLVNILKTANRKVASIGTNGVIVDELSISTGFTTPDPIILHKAFFDLYYKNIEYVVMEISAHAIYLNKVYGIDIMYLLFTNISNEHLDFFKTIENYANTKLKYFDNHSIKNCIINIDDIYGKKLIDTTTNKNITTYGINNPCDVFAMDIKKSKGKNTKFLVNAIDQIIEIETELIGEYNIYNILGAIACARLININLFDIYEGVKTLNKVDGRMEVYKIDGKTIVVDFAHTPDGFMKSLTAIKENYGDNIITLFGCVGYSDSYKRKLMGECASTFSKKIIISTDNVGFTDFNSIAKDIKSGINNGVVVEEIVDRTRAIEYAINELEDGEVLAILGKGNETVQKIRDQIVNYSDLDLVKQFIKK